LQVCGYEKDSLDSIAGYDGRVLECLQDYKDELVTPACKKRVHRLTVRAAADIRMDRPLSDACYDDRQKLCSGVQPGDARVLRCLQDSREQLSYECRATLFDQEVRLAEDIDFQFPLKKACAAEIPRFCKDIQHGGARVIQCLLLHDEATDMGDECRTEVKRHETRGAKDYRLNYRLNKACDLEIDRLCADVCGPFSGQACEGSVIQCLTQKADNVTDQA
jgi:Golgi apparatus protein 1